MICLYFTLRLHTKIYFILSDAQNTLTKCTINFNALTSVGGNRKLQK